MTRVLFGRRLGNGAQGLCLAVLAGFGLATAAEAQTGQIAGQVTDAGSGRPLASTQVYIEGTALGVLTTSSGRYLFTNAPAGEHTLVAELVGYRSETQTVTVTAGQAVTANFELSVTAIQLDQIVVTGTGVATERKRLGNSIATVDVTALADAPITSFSDVLQGREPGVVGLPGGGDTGASGRIRIRGSASLSQSNEPIIYLDGVRIDRGSNGGFGAAQAATRRIDDIDPNSIASIEILKGAAAATLYGTEASNGVINITTKRGQQGAPQWTLQTDQTAITAPLNRLIPHADFPRDAEEVARMQKRWGVSLQPYEVHVVDYMSELYSRGHAQQYSGSVSGGGDLITYFASARYTSENGPFSDLEGILPPNPDGSVGRLKNDDTIVRRQATVTLNMFPFDNVRLRVGGIYSESNQTSLAGGNNIYGVFSLGLMGQLRKATDNNRYGSLAFATLRETGERDIDEEVEHFAGSVNANWTIADGLVFDGTFGVDMSNGRKLSFFPFGWNVDDFSTYNTEGTRSIGDRNNRELTAEGKVSYENDFTDDINSQFLVGGQTYVSRVITSGGGGTSFPGPGLEVSEAGANQWINETWSKVVNAGVFLQERVGYQDWAYLTLGVRFDANSAFGADFETATYPKAGVSIIPTDLFDWNSETLSTFRIRGAWGRSGLQPGAFDKFTTFTPQPGPSGAGIRPSNLGNQALRPEITDEFEVGAEFGLWNDVVGVDVTYWDRTTLDALVPRQFPVTGGFVNTQLDNIGQLDAKGFEVSVTGRAYSGENVEVNVFANTAYIDEIITDMGGAPPLKTGGSYPRYRNYLQEGYAPASFFGAILDPDMAIPLNLNGDCTEPTRAQALEFFSTRVVDGESVGVDPSNFDVIPVGCAGGSAEYLKQYIGKPTPDFAGSFGFDVSFLGSFELSSMFEYKAGNYHTQDLTGAFRQANAVIGRNVPGSARVLAVMANPASTAEQRLDAALEWAREYRALAPMSGMNQIWTSDYIRVRELSLSYRLPANTVENMGLSSATLSLGARNAHLWMLGDYRGIDPDINPQANCTGGGTSCNFLVGTEAFGVPFPRRFSLSARVGF